MKPVQQFIDSFNKTIFSFHASAFTLQQTAFWRTLEQIGGEVSRSCVGELCLLQQLFVSVFVKHLLASNALALYICNNFHRFIMHPRPPGRHIRIDG